MPNQYVQDPVPDSDLERSRLFITKIKEHRHNKTKKDKSLSLTSFILNVMDTIIISPGKHQISKTLTNKTVATFSRHWNVPPSFSRTSIQTPSNPTVPATPMAPTPSTSTASANNPAPRLPPSNSRDTCTDWTNKWVINLSKNPLTTEQLSLLQKGPNYAITPKYPPIEEYITAV